MADDVDRATDILDRAMCRFRPPTRHAAPLRTHCSRCGEPIEPARLKVYPHALRCIACQTEWERRA